MDDDAKGLRLTPAVRRQLARRGRTVVVPPTPEQAASLREVEREGHVRTVEGIPLDVLMTLEALRVLADQGNMLAAHIYERERRRLGIDRPMFHA